jgi:hypothetical protein
VLTLWGKEDAEEEAVPWELGNIKFQVGQRERGREREIKRKVRERDDERGAREGGACDKERGR